LSARNIFNIIERTDYLTGSRSDREKSQSPLANGIKYSIRATD